MHTSIHLDEQTDRARRSKEEATQYVTLGHYNSERGGWWRRGWLVGRVEGSVQVGEEWPATKTDERCSQLESRSGVRCGRRLVCHLVGAFIRLPAFLACSLCV